MLNEKTAEMLNNVQKVLAGLLNKNPAEQDSERTDVAAEWKFFGGVRGLGGEFGETTVLVICGP
jgi:hypothetical protein